jgi:glycosyltransferase involved in cell wall biosynthesis
MMLKALPRVAILHYSASPVIGGVESVMLAHVRLFTEAGYLTTVVSGRGKKEAFPSGTEFIRIRELDSQHPRILELSHELEQGHVPPYLDKMAARLAKALTSALHSIDHVIVHNVFTKHFNLPFTVALFRLLDQGLIRHCVAWCHDITWTSPNSRSKVYAGYPWDLLRTYRSELTYVTVSKERQLELANLFGCAPEQIQVIYNGVDPKELLGLSDFGLALIDRLDLWESDLNLIMPVRVTQAKNIELALRMVAALKQSGIRARLVITGPPDPHDRMSMEYFQSLLALRTQLGIREEVRFVYESGPVAAKPFTVEMPVVSELLRVSDALFMPSHREGFGMPVLEAGLAGLPVFCADTVPAAKEIGGQDVRMFPHNAEPAHVAELILKQVRENSVLRLRRRVRQRLTWRSIFRQQIMPLLDRGAS